MNARQEWRSGPQLESTQAAIQEYLRQISKASGHSPTRIAREIGVSESTITRHWNGESKSLPHISTIRKLIERYQLAPPPALGALGAVQTGGFSEPEVILANESDYAERETLNPNQSIWIVGRSFSAIAGYRAGDRFLLDMSLTPRDGDDVVANIYDRSGKGAATVLRKFRRAWLFADGNTDPEFADGRGVAVMGVIVKSWRSRDVQ